MKRSLLGGIASNFSLFSWANGTGARERKQDTSSHPRSAPSEERLARKLVPSIGTIQHASFLASSLPTGWVEVGGFIPTRDGLQSPVKGGWHAYAYWDQLIVLDEDMVSCKVEIEDVKSIFAIARISSQTKGTVAEVDLASGKLKLYSELLAAGEVPAAVVAQVDIGFPVVAGREYQVVLQKISETYLLQFYDTVTQEGAAVSYLDTGKTPSSGKSWNAPGFIFRSGNVRLLAYHFSSNLPKSPKVLVVGDSIADGDTIRLSPNGGYKNRWAGLLATALAFNVSILARGGETSTDVIRKLPLLVSLLESPQYVLYAIGTNDSSFETWKKNYLAFKAVFEAKGAEVIPTTLFPRAGREVFCAKVTEDVVKGEGRYLDFAKALTLNGNRITRDERWFLPDKLHPSPEGHMKMFRQAKIDLPDLFS